MATYTNYKGLEKPLSTEKYKGSGGTHYSDSEPTDLTDGMTWIGGN